MEECGDRVEVVWGKELGGEVAVGVWVLFRARGVDCVVDVWE